jgi:hypothetical protein
MDAPVKEYPPEHPDSISTSGNRIIATGTIVLYAAFLLMLATF